MTGSSARVQGAGAQAVPGALADRPLARAAIATAVIGAYMAIGSAFRMSAEAYLLLGIPITIAFQALVVRRPLRALWLLAAPPLRFTPRSIVVSVVIAIAPLVVAVRGVGAGNPVLVGYGLVGVIGAVGAVYAIRALDGPGVRATLRATAINTAILVAVMVAYRLATGGFAGNPAGAVLAVSMAVATYLPVVFVLEEVTFRGLLDPYLRGPSPAPDRAFAVYGSVLWGVWHLPVASVNLGLLTLPYLVIVHTLLGIVLVQAWRRTGNLAAPGLAHAVSDAFRNGVAVL